MAKGNMFLGYARGKVGDVVFSRVNGEQVSRPRNRHPHNPRTNKQLVQRAIMATIMAAYSAGREIFDHSFQGYSVGAGCQRRFLALNAGALRTQMAIDFENATPEEALAKVTAPKIQTPIPNQYLVAEGSLKQELFIDRYNNDVPEWDLPTPQQGEKINEYAARVGMNAGDIYTFVFIETSKADADILYKTYGIASIDYDTIYRGSFGWVRLIVKNLSAVETVIGPDVAFTDLFDVEQGGVASFNTAYRLSDGPISLAVLDTANATAVNNGYAIGLIKSRRDVDLRSNSKMVVVNPDEFGLYWNDLLTAWKAGTTEIGASDLILEGGDE